VKQLRPTDLKRLHREWNRRSSGRIALLLDGVQSPYNVGAIVRSAAAYRVEHLYLAGTTTSPASAKTAKVALGTDRYLSWTAFERGADAADAAREEGYSVVGLELADAAVPLHQLTAGPDVCLVLGNEDHGIAPATPWPSCR
jgi:tRNA (guanosine-2'-O-)-methyltransferase